MRGGVSGTGPWLGCDGVVHGRPGECGALGAGQGRGGAPLPPAQVCPKAFALPPICLACLPCVPGSSIPPFSLCLTVRSSETPTPATLGQRHCPSRVLAALSPPPRRRHQAPALLVPPKLRPESGRASPEVEPGPWSSTGSAARGSGPGVTGGGRGQGAWERGCGGLSGVSLSRAR